MVGFGELVELSWRGAVSGLRGRTGVGDVLYFFTSDGEASVGTPSVS
jgi:hypothetical protein